MMEPTSDGWRLVKRDAQSFEPLDALELKPPHVPDPEQDDFRWLVDRAGEQLTMLCVRLVGDGGELWIIDVDLNAGRLLQNQKLLDSTWPNDVVIGPMQKFMIVSRVDATRENAWAMRDIVDFSSLEKRYVVGFRPGNLFTFSRDVLLSRDERYLFIYGNDENRTWVVWRFDLERRTWSWPRRVEFTQGGTLVKYSPASDCMTAVGS